MGEMRGAGRVMLGLSIHSGAESETLGVALCVHGISVERHSICVSGSCMDGVTIGLLAYLDQLVLGYVLQGMFNLPTLDSYILFSCSFDSAIGSRVEESFRELTFGIPGTDTHPWPWGQMAWRRRHTHTRRFEAGIHAGTDSKQFHGVDQQHEVCLRRFI